MTVTDDFEWKTSLPVRWHNTVNIRNEEGKILSQPGRPWAVKGYSLLSN
jgi:hypothetical protein